MGDGTQVMDYSEWLARCEDRFRQIVVVEGDE
jgi:hypothetical protein